MSTPETPKQEKKSKRGMRGIGRDMIAFSVGVGIGWFGNTAYLNHTNAIRTPQEREAATRAAKAAAAQKTT
jgi:hypothetical protein